MSASWPGSMSGPRVAKTPRLLRLVLLLWLLLNSLSGTGFCQDYDTDVPETEDPADPGIVDGGEVQPSETPPDEPEVETNPTNTDVEEGETSGTPSGEEVSGPTESSSVSTTPTGDGTDEGILDDLNPIIILIPVVLVVLIIGMIVCGIFINRRWKNQVTNQDLRKEDPYLDGSSTEKVPMPMFEEDVPSVLELEMEELDQWMKKDGESADDSEQV